MCSPEREKKYIRHVIITKKVGNLLNIQKIIHTQQTLLSHNISYLNSETSACRFDNNYSNKLELTPCCGDEEVNMQNMKKSEKYNAETKL